MEKICEGGIKNTSGLHFIGSMADTSVPSPETHSSAVEGVSLRCDVYHRLLVNYERVLEMFSKSVHHMNESKDCPHVEFMALWKLAQALHVKCRDANFMLKRHMEEHGC